MAAGNRRGYKNAEAIPDSEREKDDIAASQPGANGPEVAQRIPDPIDAIPTYVGTGPEDAILTAGARAEAILDEVLSEHDRADALVRGVDLRDALPDSRAMKPVFDGFEPVASVPEERSAASRYIPAVTWAKAHPDQAVRILNGKGSPAATAQTINKAFGESQGVKAVTRTDPDTKVTSVYVQASE